MTDRRGQTLPSDSLADEEDAQTAAYLVRVLSCERPLAPSTRHWLDGIDKVIVGRRDTAGVSRDGRVLTLHVDDARLSTKHFEIDVGRGGASHVLRDLGSTNGTKIDGVAIAETSIEDGHVIEAGKTFFVFREAVPRTSTGTDDEVGAADGDATMQSLAAPLEATLLLASRIAVSRVPVLLTSPTGTGKEVVARAIHRMSGRGGPFVAVNCAAIPATLVESELFGHKRGAFSGAIDDRLGLVRSADGGTLLLDEIGDLAPAAQAALLRVLQENEVLPVGATRPVAVDLRVVAASHRSLRDLVTTGAFRADLLARLAGYELTLLPLHDRLEDLGVLIATFLRRHAPAKAEAIVFSSAAARALFAYAWPRNVRELERTIEAAAVLAADGVLRAEYLPEPIRTSTTKRETDVAVDEDARKRAELVALLEQHAWNVSAVARATGKARMQIQRWMKRYGLQAPRR